MMKIAIVGCGGIAAVHAAVLSHIDGVTIAAFADIKPERAEKFVAQYGGKAYSSLESLLEQETIDVLHICTPHYLHVPMALSAHEKGIHVFTEKPPAINIEQFNQLAEASKSGAKIGVCFQNRYNDSVQYIKELIGSEKAGKILGARAFVTWQRGLPYYTESGWRGALATEGGGALINQSIHTLDLLIYFLGKPQNVEASCHNRHLKGKIEVEDTVEAYLDYGDKNALFYATTAHCADSPVFLEIVCENLTVRMEETSVTLRYKDGTKEEISFERASVLGKSYWGNGHHACISDFYRCLNENDRFPIGVEDVRDTAEAMFDIYKNR